MEYTQIGRSGLRISRLVLGTMNFGCYCDEKEAFRIMDAALDLGINYFDTADNYGKSIGQEGITESLIGRWFQQGGNRREKVVLATKVHEEMHDETDGPNSPSGLSAYKIRRHFESSLKRLQTDHVEIYYMHHVDRRVRFEELWQAFDVLLSQGRIDYVASSNFAAWDLITAQEAARRSSQFGLLCEQHCYNLMCRLPELEVLPAAQAEGIGIIPWGPLNGGLLSRSALSFQISARAAKMEGQVEKYRAQLTAYADLCNELGEAQDTVALAWLLANPAVTAPIIGPRTLKHLEDSVRALQVNLDESVMKRLDEIFPGPGGAAPEAYAW